MGSTKAVSPPAVKEQEHYGNGSRLKLTNRITQKSVDESAWGPFPCIRIKLWIMFPFSVNAHVRNGYSRGNGLGKIYWGALIEDIQYQRLDQRNIHRELRSQEWEHKARRMFHRWHMGSLARGQSTVPESAILAWPLPNHGQTPTWKLETAVHSRKKTE